jgi:hypothetical protein
VAGPFDFSAALAGLRRQRFEKDGDGAAAGVFGMLAAHEMIHSRRRERRILKACDCIDLARAKVSLQLDRASFDMRPPGASSG